MKAQGPIQLPGRCASDISRLVETIGADSAGYEFASVGPGTYRMARAARPSWATAAGVVATLPTLGAGALFFLVKRVETCMLTVTESPSGAVLATTGRLPDGYLDAFHRHLRTPLSDWARPKPDANQGPGPSPAPVDNQKSTPHDQGDESDQSHTVARRRSAVAATPAHDPFIRFDNGLTVPLSSTVIVGRRPVAVHLDSNPRLVAIDDPDRQISKTHFAIGTAPGQIWVEDRHSTNGTSFSDDLGRTTELEPGRRTALPMGSSIMFGGQKAEVSQP